MLNLIRIRDGLVRGTVQSIPYSVKVVTARPPPKPAVPQLPGSPGPGRRNQFCWPCGQPRPANRLG